ncbi:sulfatase family protein [Tessaracoccus antarcticus]|uniref:Sulfatase n=1 Tax=Tessaracoccus antarcticus TaxID=2479848 RepID=A0A3M0G602_9ACTN|nr:sulfatase [Tessaracoccus antarcticus]RMB57223.1 sulfatase [Tessaracoccus antarcticus]
MTTTDPRPNIVLIHGHDIGRWLSCYGLPNIPTPNLDKFSRKSVVFESAFATAPLCTPSRGSMLTGRLPHANGLNGLAHDSWLYFDDVRTLPEYLREMGYHTALIGLQHEHPDPLVLGYDHVGGLGFLPRTEPVVDAAIEWLSSRDGDGPYFCNVGVWEAHRPWPATDYAPVDPASVHVPAYLPDNEYTRADISAMYGSLSQFDDGIGRLLETIDDETLVVITTDHGVPFPRAKSTLYDSGVGVALIIRPPASWDIKPRREDSVVSHLDFVPTLVEIAGGQPDDEWDGQSLLSLLRDGSMAGDRELVLEKTYHDIYDPIRAIRTGNRKYIRNFIAGPKLPLAKDLEDSQTRQGMGDAHLEPRPEEELYDLSNDPDELTNLVGESEWSGEVERFRSTLLNRMRESGDELLDNPIEAMPTPSRPTRKRR